MLINETLRTRIIRYTKVPFVTFQSIYSRLKLICDQVKVRLLRFNGTFCTFSLELYY